MAVNTEISRQCVTPGARRRHRLPALLLALSLTVPGQAADGTGLFETIRAETELLRASGRVSYSAITLLEPDLVAEIYERNRFAPLWTDQDRVAAMPEVIRSSHDEGLDPADYHLERIERVLDARAAGRQLTDRGLAVFDILLTDGLAALVLDLRFGKVAGGPLSAAEARTRLVDGLEPVLAVEKLIESRSLSSALTSALPRSTQYLRLRAALQRYRRIGQSGAWPRVPDGPTISPGSEDPRVRALARRLAVSGDLADGDDRRFAAYDEALQAAVRRFQLRHGLEPDAEVGPATLAAMNVPVTARIDQIRLNLERARWNYDADRRDFVLVNVPAFRAHLIQSGEELWSTRVIVGEVDTETPLFQAEMKYVVLNPTWTVPYKIASEELLPTIRSDPSFLARGGYRLFDRAGGPVDPAGVDWAALNSNDFPLTLVQQPGPGNQLGRIKFVFPNEYAVFMHDTPAKNLFGRACRAFSHGCIRVDQPLDLAERLLEREGWTRERIEAGVASGETQTIFLAEPVPVILVYWTAAVDDHGVVYFFDDIYSRDRALLAALDATVR
jgi:murein L,D-transpeptidase YcbB/YkuD